MPTNQSRGYFGSISSLEVLAALLDIIVYLFHTSLCRFKPMLTDQALKYPRISFIFDPILQYLKFGVIEKGMIQLEWFC